MRTAVVVTLLAAVAAALAAPQLVQHPLDKVAAAPATTTTTTAAPEAVEATTLSEAQQEDDCTEQIGKIINGEVVNKMRKYDVEQVLEQHGGAAGKLNVTRNREVPELEALEMEEAEKDKLLPDTDNATYYVYDYRRTDFKTFVRLEHALLRNKGKQDEFEDVRGELYWTPPDFCGRLRHASYRVDREGFAADVSLEYCFLNEVTLQCAWPATCTFNETFRQCVAAPSSALLATLVG